MPDIGIGATVLSAGTSLFSANQANEAAGEQSDIARMTAQIGRDQWKIWKQQYLPSEKRALSLRDSVNALNKRMLPVVEGMMKRSAVMQKTNAKILKSAYRNTRLRENIWKSGMPILEALDDAVARGAKDRTGFVQREARTQIGTQYDRAREEQALRDRRYGIDPTSGRAMALERQMAQEEAGRSAAAVNLATENERRRQEQWNVDATAKAAGVHFGVPTPTSGVPSYAGVGPSQPGYGSFQTGANTLAGAGNQYGALGGGYADAAGELARFAMNNPFGGSGGGAAPVSPQIPAYQQTPAYGLPVQTTPGTPYATGGTVGVEPMGYAEGGTVTGPGTGMSDSVPGSMVTPQGNEEPVRLSTGEFVIPAQVVNRILMQQLHKMAGIKEGGP